MAKKHVQSASEKRSLRIRQVLFGLLALLMIVSMVASLVVNF